MAEIGKLAGICLVAAVFSVLLKKHDPEMSLLVTLAACLVILTALLQGWQRIADFLQEVCAWGTLSPEIFAPLLKTVGIALISRVGAELCRDAEQNAPAMLLELAGALAALVTAVPLFEQVWEVLQNWG